MKYMWFGTRERMSWIPCPAVDADLSKVGWAATSNYLNGGAAVRRSATAGKAYQFSWNLMSAAELNKFTAYADGLYGPGPFYFVDPFSRANVFPQYWAAPRLAAQDAPPLVLDSRPTLVDTAANAYGYPTKSAVYTLTSSDDFASVWLPVPPGYDLHLGAHGSATGTASVQVDYPQTPVDYAWTGSANASTSTQTVGGVLSRTNLATNPRGQAGAGWSPIGATTSVDIPDVDFAAGQAVEVTWNNTTPEATLVPRLNIGGVAANLLSAGPFSASIDVKPVGAGTQNMVMRAYCYDAGDNVLTTTPSTGAVSCPEGVVTRLSLSNVAPAGTYRVMILVGFADPTGRPASAAFRTGSLLIEQTASVGNYFDGGTADVPATATTSLSMLGVDTPTLTNHTVAGESGVTVTLAGEGTLTLAGLVAALLPTGSAAPTGMFPPGDGHSGCDFQAHPTISGYSAALDRKGATATLIEVGAWL